MHQISPLYQSHIHELLVSFVCGGGCEFSEGESGPHAGQALITNIHLQPGVFDFRLGLFCSLFLFFKFTCMCVDHNLYVEAREQVEGVSSCLPLCSFREIKLRSSMLMAGAFTKEPSQQPTSLVFCVFVLNTHFMFFFKRIKRKKITQSPEETLIVGVTYKNSGFQEDSFRSSLECTLLYAKAGHFGQKPLQSSPPLHQVTVGYFLI